MGTPTRAGAGQRGAVVAVVFLFALHDIVLDAPLLFYF
jgi:hypothetical protein